MLLIDEKSLGTIATAEIEAMAVQMLIDNNFEVVDQEMVRREPQEGPAAAEVGRRQPRRGRAGPPVSARRSSSSGEAVAKPSARRIAESNLRTYQAVVTLRAIRTDNSETS